MSLIDGAELTLYLKGGDSHNIDLSPVQLAAIVNLLGLEYDTDNNTVKMFSDEGLISLVGKTLGRLREI